MAVAERNKMAGREESERPAAEEAEKSRKKSDNIHKGHRERLRRSFLTGGLEGMSDIQVLELLLTFSLSQIDVNPLAHTLLNTFGTISGVLNARYEELLKVHGVGTNTATMLCLMQPLAARCQADRSKLGGQLTCGADYWQEFSPYLCGQREEVCYMLCLDGMRKLITGCKLAEGVVNKVTVPQRKVLEAALRHNAAAVVLGHNHVSGFAKPSSADIAYTQSLGNLLWSVDINLLDHLVVVDDDWVSMKESGYI